MVVLDESANLGCDLGIIRRAYTRKMAFERRLEPCANLCAIPAHQEHLANGPNSELLSACRLSIYAPAVRDGPQPVPSMSPLEPQEEVGSGQGGWLMCKCIPIKVLP